MTRCEHSRLAADLEHWIEVVSEVETHLGGAPGCVDSLDAVNWVSLLEAHLRVAGDHRCTSRAIPRLVEQGQRVLGAAEVLVGEARERGVFETSLYGSSSAGGLVSSRDGMLAAARRSGGGHVWGVASLHPDLRVLEHAGVRDSAVLLTRHPSAVGQGELGAHEARRSSYEQELLWGGAEIGLWAGQVSLRSGPAGWARWYSCLRSTVAGVIDVAPPGCAHVLAGADVTSLQARLEVVAGLDCTTGAALVEAWELSADVLALT